MAKPEWGIKRICLSCGARFYDLSRVPIACPKCGAEFQAEDFLRSRRGKGSAEKAAAKRKELVVDAEVPVVDEDVEIEVADPEVEDEVMEDTEELGKDEDDMPEIEGQEEE